MRPADAVATPALDIVDAGKVYQQWQRTGRARDIVQNLLRPQRRTVRALSHLTLRVMPGEFVAYAGANGAGKSTTIKLLSGILLPSEGTVRVLGLDPAKDRIALMRRIGVCFGQRTELWWDHPVITSFEWKRDVWDIPGPTYRRNLDMVTQLLDLGDILHTFARELSLGQRMRADLGMLLLHSPEVIFLDEPTLGLDVLAKQRMIDFLRQINRESGVTILVTSHDMDDLEAMAQRIVLLRDGEKAFDGDFASLRRAAGAYARVRVRAPGPAPQVEGAAYLRSQDGVHEYAFDGAGSGVQALLGSLARCPLVQDVEIGKAPIEDVIAGLYRAWREARS